jgi:hypothetical protein
MVKAAVGAVGYEVSVHSVAGWPLVVLTLSGFGALYVAYSGQVRDQHDVKALSHLAYNPSATPQIDAMRRVLSTLPDRTTGAVCRRTETVARQNNSRLRGRPRQPAVTTVENLINVTDEDQHTIAP